MLGMALLFTNAGMRGTGRRAASPTADGPVTLPPVPVVAADICGDANGDGYVNVMDSAILASLIKESSTIQFDPSRVRDSIPNLVAPLRLMDINQDGKYSQADKQALERMIESPMLVVSDCKISVLGDLNLDRVVSVGDGVIVRNLFTDFPNQPRREYSEIFNWRASYRKGDYNCDSVVNEKDYDAIRDSVMRMLPLKFSCDDGTIDPPIDPTPEIK